MFHIIDPEYRAGPAIGICGMLRPDVTAHDTAKRPAVAGNVLARFQERNDADRRRAFGMSAAVAGHPRQVGLISTPYAPENEDAPIAIVIREMGACRLHQIVESGNGGQSARDRQRLVRMVIRIAQTKRPRGNRPLVEKSAVPVIRRS